MRQALTPLEAAIFNSKNRGIAAFLERVSLPLYRATRTQQEPIGTGTLLRVNGAHYLVTAAHVVEKCPAGTIALPIDAECKQVSTLGPHELVRSIRSKHDVALIALHDAKTVERLRSSWTILEPRHLSSPGSAGPYIVCGYQEPNDVAARGLTRPGKQLTYVCARYTGPIEDATADPLDLEHDLLLDLQTTSLSMENLRPMPTPKFNGVSGASVWEMVPEPDHGVWTPASQLRLVAVQSGALHFKYLRAKRWHLLWSAFRQLDSKGAGAVRRSITNSIRTRSKSVVRPRRPNSRLKTK